MKRRLFLWLLVVLGTVLSIACRSENHSNASSQATTRDSETKQASVVRYKAQIVAEYNHDSQAFTQGLVFDGGVLYESTGQYGLSSLRQVELTTGNVLKQVSISSEYFAEGLALHGSKLYQLTWKEQKGFVYETGTLARIAEWSYQGEGWGLTSDGVHLIKSDGTNILQFINPETFAVEKTLHVQVSDRPLRQLNELEIIKGDIYANVWLSPRIVRIDAKTGNVTGVIDCSDLVRQVKTSGDSVLNGIAYDAKNDRIFLTGKNWSKLFEVRFVEVNDRQGS